MPANKVNSLAGEESVGKTFFMLGILKNFLEKDPKASAIIFETEGSITKDILVSRGIDTKRVLVIPIDTIQKFKTQALCILKKYGEKKKSDRYPLLLALDSLGNISTTKEMTDSEIGKDVKDMTRTQEIKAAFRVLTLKMSQVQVPFVVTNHVYQTMGMFPTKEASGGSGLKYCANNIIALGKSKEKDAEGNVTGAIIRCKVLKSRITREQLEARVLLSFNKGMDRYYGLLPIAIEAGIFNKVANKVELPDKSTVFENAILKNGEKFFTKEVLDQIDAYCQKNFMFGDGENIDSGDQLEEILNEKENDTKRSK
jgi:RecA/RadA recombinase